MAERYQVPEYPLEIEQTVQGAYWSKGWHSRGKAAEAANFEAEFLDYEGKFEESDVRYEIWRCIPASPDDECYVWFWPAKLGTQGSFPVTVIGD